MPMILLKLPPRSRSISKSSVADGQSFRHSCCTLETYCSKGSCSYSTVDVWETSEAAEPVEQFKCVEEAESDEGMLIIQGVVFFEVKV